MVMTDPIADLLTRMRNGLRNGVESVSMPSSKIKISILEVLKREGFIGHFDIIEKPVQNELQISFKYGDRGESVIRKLKRTSKPSLRTYAHSKDLLPVLDGMGIKVVSTSKGVMSDREARDAGVGGEILCEVW